VHLHVSMKHSNLSALLVRRGLVDLELILQAAETTKGTSCTWLEYLLLAGVLDEDQLCACLIGNERVQRCDLNELARVPHAVLASVPPDVAIEHRVVPVGVDADGYLRLVMVDPTDAVAVEEVGFFTGRSLLREVANASMVAWALHHYYGGESVLWPRAPQQSPVVGAPYAFDAAQFG
jgi:hypothetical protein